MSIPLDTNAPITVLGQKVALRADAALSASGAYAQAGEVLDVRDARVVVLRVAYDAAGVGGSAGLLPLGSLEDDKPLSTDDVWGALPILDGTVTAEALSGAVASGADFTAAQDYGKAVVYGTLALTVPAGSDADEIRQIVVVDVSAVKWFSLHVAEDGNTAAPGSLAVDACIGA